LKIAALIGFVLIMGSLVWAMATANVKPEPLPGYTRWQNFVYVCKGRLAYALIATFCFIVASNAMRVVRHGGLELMGWISTGATVIVIALYAVILAWPLPPSVHRQEDKLESA